MANFLYDNARKQFALAGLNWETGDYRAFLLDLSNYTASASHIYLSEVSTAARNYGEIIDVPSGKRAYQDGKTITPRNVEDNGALDGGDVTFDTIDGNPIGAVLIAQWLGDPNTSQLIAYLDQATGLVITPNGGDIIVTWDNGTNRIFRL